MLLPRLPLLLLLLLRLLRMLLQLFRSLLLLLFLLTLELPASLLPSSPICARTSFSSGRLNAAGVQGMGVHHPLHRRRLATHILFGLVIK